MSDMLDAAMRKARSLPVETQEEIARMILIYADVDAAVVHLSPEEEADLAEADAEVERGELASDEDVAAVLATYKIQG